MIVLVASSHIKRPFAETALRLHMQFLAVVEPIESLRHDSTVQRTR